MLKRIVIASLINISFVPFITKTLDSDSRSTREVILEINADQPGTFTVLNDLEVTLCQKFQDTWTTLAATDTQITVTCDPVPITSAGTISTPGTYCLANDIVGLITIATDDVVLDGNGHVIIPTDTGIDVSASTTNVIIRNVTIDGGSAEGIVVRTNCSNVIIKDSSILNCGTDQPFPQFAILFDNAENSVVDNVIIINCRQGIHLDTTNNCIIKNCEILQCNNTDASGFSRGIFLDSISNVIVESCRVKELFADIARAFTTSSPTNQVVFKKCIASEIGNGSGESIGFFITTAVDANIVFEDCIAKNLTAGGGDVGTGFNFANTDMIVCNRCKALNVTGNTSSHGFAATFINCLLFRDCESSGNDGRGFEMLNGAEPILINCIACENATQGYFIQLTTQGVILKSTAKGNGDNGFELFAGTPTDWVIGKSVSIGNGVNGFVNPAAGQPNRFFENFAQGNTGSGYVAMPVVTPVQALGASPKSTGANIDA